jgi:hypothetical protein
MFVTDGITVFLFSLVTDFRYSALAKLLTLLLINDIPVCSCKVAIGVILGNFVIILKNLFLNICSLFMQVLAA